MLYAFQENMTFIPYNNKIQIEPIKEEMFMESEDPVLSEMGKVVAIGKDVKFCKVGDTLFFTSWGVDKTPVQDGKNFYVVEENSEFILGKIENE